MKIPGFTTILLYHFKGKDLLHPEENIKLFSLSALVNNKWIFEYFPENTCMKRWQDGNKLFYLLNKENEPCSFAWIRNGTKHFVGELNKTLIFSYKVNCIFDCITPEKLRGKGYYSSLITRLSIQENEYPSFMYAASSNIASNKGIVKSGFELTHKIFRFLYFVTIKDLRKSSFKIICQAG